MAGRLSVLTRAHLGAPRWHAVLHDRRLIRVAGTDAASFLQGLVTNDVASLTPGASVHAAFLNRTGRVLFDALVCALPGAETRAAATSSPTHPAFIIDCDAQVRDALHAHLRKYRLRADVTLELEADRSFTVIALGGPDVVRAPPAPTATDNVFAAPDPRRPELGVRAVAPADHPVLADLLQSSVEVPPGLYDLARTLLAVAEGPEDLPQGECLPLESNLDLHRAISFNKGCYLGQELTARTHFTGVIRKRIVPVVRASDCTSGGSTPGMPVALSQLPQWCQTPAVTRALAGLGDAVPTAAGAPLAPPGWDVRLPGRGAALGKIRSSVLGVAGLALLRLDALDGDDLSLRCVPAAAEEEVDAGGETQGEVVPVDIVPVLPPFAQSNTKRN